MERPDDAGGLRDGRLRVRGRIEHQHGDHEVEHRLGVGQVVRMRALQRDALADPGAPRGAFRPRDRAAVRIDRRHVTGTPRGPPRGRPRRTRSDPEDFRRVLGIREVHQPAVLGFRDLRPRLKRRDERRRSGAPTPRGRRHNTARWASTAAAMRVGA